MRESSSHAITSITGNASLFKKTYVPKYIFTLSKVTSDLVNLCFSFGALILVIIFTGVPVTWRVLLFWVPILQLYVFCVGLGLFLAQFAVFFRDIQYIWHAVTTAWLYLTPLFYPVDLLPETVQWAVVTFNPMYSYITMFRELVVYGIMPSLQLFLHGAVIAFAVLLIGVWTFLRQKNHFILYI